MKKCVIVGAFFLFMQVINAEIINISGKIVNEGTSEGIAGARISLKKFFSLTKVEYSPIICYSNETGAFTLSGNTGALDNSQARLIHGITVRSVGKGAGFLIRINGRHSSAAIDLFRSDGRRLASKRFVNPREGDCCIPFSHPVSSMYFVKISLDDESRVFKTVPGMGIACSMISRKASAAGSLAKNAASVSDSLIVIKGGFRTALQAVQSYEVTDLSIPVKASNTWIPSGALERQGGMVKIMAKGHDFEMGQPNDTVRGVFFDMPTSDLEQPVHTVTFTHDFWMDTTEVTQGEYDSLMKITYTDSSREYKGCAWSASNGMGRTVAVYSVLWGDAALFCNARSKAHGLPDTAYSYESIRSQLGSLCTLKNVSVNMDANAYRLPTEAEWEYACRAGTTTDFYWGKNLSDYATGSQAEIDKYAVWYYNSFGLGKDTTEYGAHPVGKKLPNKYGLYDMLGNVSEWCNDWLDYYAFGPTTDPTGPETGGIQALRGGNWGNDITYIRATERLYAASDYPYFFMGFRVVKQINE